MKDLRVKSLREAIQRLAESLEATVRVERWDLEDAVPESLSRAAAEVGPRLDTANRLAADIFVSSNGDAASVSALREAAARLARAYGTYRENSGDPRSASLSLDQELDQVRSETRAW